MLLVDTSVWSDHLRRGDARLAILLEQRLVSVHPFTIGEIACGQFPERAQALEAMLKLPAAPVVGQAELLGFIDRHSLAGRGVGYVDIHLIASALVAGHRLWTRDRRMAQLALGLGLASPAQV
jgi:predicted nucleic acid-binding protein